MNGPVPLAVQMPWPETPLTVPFRAIVPWLEHRFWLLPAFTDASVVMLTMAVSLTAGQGPLFVEVSVNVTKPLVISAGVMK